MGFYNQRYAARWNRSTAPSNTCQYMSCQLIPPYYNSALAAEQEVK